MPYYPNIDRQDVQIALPKSRPISLPVSKPMIQLPVSRPKIPDVPVGRPAPSVDPFDDARRLIALADTDKLNRFGGGVERQALRDKPIEAIYDEATGDYTFKEIDEPKLTIADLLKEYDDEELRDAAEYLVTQPRTLVKKRDIEEDQGIIIPSAFAGDIESEVEKKEKDQGISLLAKIINLLRPRYTTESAGFEEIGGEEEFPPSDVIRSSRFNDGGIVQGFGKGGAISGARRKSDFSTNISGNVSGATYAGRDDPYREDRSTPTTTTTPTIESLYRPESSPAPRSQSFIDSYNNPFSKYVEPFSDFMGKMQGFDMGTEQGRYDFYQTTQKNVAEQERDQIKRRKRLDTAEAKLAEEQRLRDMIAGMMPQQTPITPNPIVDPTPPTVSDDPSGVVIPSTRIPNFDIANLSPYPTFGVPGTKTYPAVIPSGITPELLKNLFTMQGVPATTMQEGGSVNKLDTAIDDFLGSMRSVA